MRMARDHSPGPERSSSVETFDEVRCRALVLSCIDYRSVEPLHGFLRDAGLAGATDIVGWPGGALALLGRDRDPVMGAIHTACELHDPRELILAVHEDCGRIGASVVSPGHQAEISMLETSLSVAAEWVATRLPDLTIRLLRLDRRGATEVAIDGDRRDEESP